MKEFNMKKITKNIFKDKSGTYYYRKMINGHLFTEYGYATEQEALAGLHLLLYKLYDGSLISKDEKQFSCKELEPDFKKFVYKKFKITTANRSMYVVEKYIFPFFKNYKVSALTNVGLLAFVNQVNKLDVDRSYIRNLAVHYFDFLKMFGLSNKVNLNLVYDINVISKGTQHSQSNFFELKEFVSFYKSLESDVSRFMFLILFLYGLRMSELRGLMIKDFNLKTNELSISRNLTAKASVGKSIVVDTKTKSSNRVVPLVPFVVDLFNKVKSHNKDFLFYNSSTKKVYGETTITRIKNDACAKAQVQQIKIHEFRHSCISYLSSQDVPQLLIKRFVGHSNSNVTEGYIHTTKNDALSLHNALIKVTNSL